MSIFWKSKILLAAIEATYGTDAAPVAANAVLASAVTFSGMEGTDVARNLDRAFFAADPTIPADMHAKITFKVELAPSGTAGTAPAWGPLLRACGVAETITAATSVTYNPITDNPESVTFYFWIGGTQYKITGARGTCTFRANASGIPMLEFEFNGLFGLPAEVATVVPDYTAFENPLVASNTNTPTFKINNVALKMSAFAHALGKAVTPRFLIGGDEILITGGADTIDLTIDAVPVTTLNPYSLAAAQTQVPIDLVHGTVAGAIAALNYPAALVQRPQALADANGIAQWPLKFSPQPQIGNDQWTLTLT